ncbi:MAG: hypothetical protein J7J82_02195 [Staphylothermus sp.]|nr:hypothetical protein [Staphylothermus sp.]
MLEQVFKSFNKILSDRRIGAFIDSLKYIVNIGYYTAIEKELGFRQYSISNLVEKLRNQGISFSAHPDFRNLGLMNMHVIISNYLITLDKLKYKDWLRFFAHTSIPVGTVTSYYLPFNFKRELSHHIMKAIKEIVPSNENIYFVIYENNMRLQPALSRYTFDEHPLIRGYRVDELIQMFDKIYNEIDINSIEEDEPTFNMPGDMVDLLLVKEFELDAFSNLYVLAKKLGIPLKTLNKHLYSHVINRQMLRGIYLKAGMFYKLFKVFYDVVIETKNRRVFLSLLRFIPSLELSMGMQYTNIRGRHRYVLHTALIKPLKGFDPIISFFYQLHNDGLIDKIITYIILPSSVRKYGIPYMNFYQDERRWDLDTEKTQALFEKRFPKAAARHRELIKEK